MTAKRYEVSVSCGMYCLGGSPSFTEVTEYLDGSEWVKASEHEEELSALRSRLAAAEAAIKSMHAESPAHPYRKEDTWYCPDDRVAIDAAHESKP